MDDRLSRDDLVHELQSAGATVRGNVIGCPFHEDRSASGSIYQGQDGVWRFKCHAGTCGFRGDLFDVRARAENRQLRDVLRRDKSVIATYNPPKVYGSLEEIVRTGPGPLEKKYTYTDPDTSKADLIILRFKKDDGKTFWQVSPTDGGFQLKAPPKPWPLYNRTRMKDADEVIVVEGEKCVHALHDIGIVATTSPGGAKNAQKADWTPLKGKTVYLWPDNDSAGIGYMQEVAEILARLDCRLLWIDPTSLGLPAKGDVVDFLADLNADAGRKAVRSLLNSAKPTGASNELRQLLEDTISGQRKAIQWPWSALSNLTKALLPGTVTLLCGEPGSSKSFLMLQAVAYWNEQGIKVAIFELEEDRAHHLNRALTQHTARAELVDPDWIAANGDEALALHDEHRAFIDSISKCIYGAPDECVDLRYLAKWAEARGREGCRIIVIDPATAAVRNGEAYSEDQQFITALKATARKYGASIVVVTHPVKGRNKKITSMDDLAGGAAYQRLSQTILWLQPHPQMEVTIGHATGRSEVKINRTINLLKTRNGRGSGLAIGMTFSDQSLTLVEHGVILPQVEECEQ